MAFFNTTCNRHHDDLTVPITQSTPPTLDEYSFLPTVGYVATWLQVAAMIVYGRNRQYTAIAEGKIIRDDSTSLSTTNQLDEHQRAGVAISLLQMTFGHEFCIQRSPNDTSRISPFRGGGDIHIFRLGGGAVILAPDSNLADDLSGGGDSSRYSTIFGMSFSVL